MPETMREAVAPRSIYSSADFGFPDVGTLPTANRENWIEEVDAALAAVRARLEVRLPATQDMVSTAIVERLAAAFAEGNDRA